MPKLKYQTKESNLAKKIDIIETSIELFLSKSIDEVSVDEISSEVGIGRTLFYHYFKNKDQLLEEVAIYIENKFFGDLTLDLRYLNRSFNSLIRSICSKINDDSSIFLVNLLFQIEINLHTLSTIKYPTQSIFYIFKEIFKDLNDTNSLIYPIKESYDILLTLFLGMIKERMETSNKASITSNQINKILIKETIN